MQTCKLANLKCSHFAIPADTIWTASGEFGTYPRSLARTFAARSYKQWIKRNLQTENQIPDSSEWLDMRSCHDGMLEDTNSLDGAHIPSLPCILSNQWHWSVFKQSFRIKAYKKDTSFTNSKKVLNCKDIDSKKLSGQIYFITDRTLFDTFIFCLAGNQKGSWPRLQVSWCFRFLFDQDLLAEDEAIPGHRHSSETEVRRRDTRPDEQEEKQTTTYQ